jgi:hypothetical protein
MHTLRVEGILYPPQPSRPAPSTVRNACEEYGGDEIEQLLLDVVGIPVCIEHNTRRVVGVVNKAARTASSAVWVDFTIDGGTADSLYAIGAVTDGSLCGLSLSHSYEFGHRPNLTMDSALRPGEAATKRTRELSLCADPARAGCFVHKVTQAEAIVQGVVDASAENVDRINDGIRGIVSASAMESDGAEADLPPPDAVVAPVPDVPPPEVAPPEGNQSIEAMILASEMLVASTKATSEAQRDRDEFRKERDDLLMSQQVLQKQIDEQRALSLSQSQAHAVQLQEVETARHMQTLKTLQETLVACGQPAASLPLPKLVDGDLAAQQKAIADTAISMAAQAAQAIKGLTSTSQATEMRADHAQMQAKRARDQTEHTQAKLTTLAHNLQNFGGGNPTAGLMQASAEGAPSKVQRLGLSVPEEMEKFRIDNPKALLKDYRSHLQGITGTVNASADRYSLNPVAADRQELSAKNLYSNLYRRMMEMNTGRLPSQSDVEAIIESVRPTERGHYMQRR